MQRQKVAIIEEQRRVLELRLDYMVRYLELGRQTLPDNTFQEILQCVKSAQTWARQPQHCRNSMPSFVRRI